MLAVGNFEGSAALAQRLIKKEPFFLAAYPLLADSYQKIGSLDTALKYYFDYALMAEKKQDKNDIGAAYIGIGWCYQQKGQYQKSHDFYEKALALSRAVGNKLNEAVALRKLAVWYTDQNDYVQALELLTKSSEINREKRYSYEHRYNLACDYFDIGLVFANKDDFATAKEFYQKSLLLFERLRVRKELSDCYFNLGEIYLFEKQYQKALDLYTKGLALDRQQNNKMNLATDFNMVGELYTEMDNLDQAQEYFNQALLLAKESGAQPDLADIYRNLGILHKKMKRYNKAREFLRQAQEIYSTTDKTRYLELKQELLDLSE